MKRADRVWRRMVTLVMESRDEWRRQVIDATGLPFSRVRALRRLDERPLSLRELAYSMACDAPAATVAVNDLEQRGLVERRPHPDDARAKLVSLTPAGRRKLAKVHDVGDPAPAVLAALSAAELDVLARLLDC